MWDRVCSALMDFEFLQAKIGAHPGQEGNAPASIFELLQDFVEALEGLPQGHPPGRGTAAPGD